MYAAQNKDAIRPEIYPHLSVAKGDYVSNKYPSRSYSIPFP